MKVKDHTLIRILSVLTTLPYRERYMLRISTILGVSSEGLYKTMIEFSSEKQDSEHYFIKDELKLNNIKVYRINWKKIIFDFLQEINRSGGEKIISANQMKNLEFNPILKMIFHAMFLSLSRHLDEKITFHELFEAVSNIIQGMETDEIKWLIIDNTQENLTGNEKRDLIKKLEAEYEKLIKTKAYKDFQELRHILIIEQPFVKEWKKEIWMYFPVAFGSTVGLRKEMEDIFCINPDK